MSPSPLFAKPFSSLPSCVNRCRSLFLKRKNGEIGLALSPMLDSSVMVGLKSVSICVALRRTQKPPLAHSTPSKRSVPPSQSSLQPRSVLFVPRVLSSYSTPQPKLLLFLDEPTSGLDSQSAWAIVSFLRSLADQGQAILCTYVGPPKDEIIVLTILQHPSAFRRTLPGFRSPSSPAQGWSNCLLWRPRT